MARAPFRIVIAAPAQYDEIDALEKTAFGAGSWGVGDVVRTAVTPGVVVLAAELTQSAALCGFLLWRMIGEEAEILTVGVAPTARRTGIGLALVTRALQGAVDAGAVRMVLDVASGNAGARALYRRSGFTEFGRRPRYYRSGEDALLLGRDLIGGGALPAQA